MSAVHAGHDQRLWDRGFACTLQPRPPECFLTLASKVSSELAMAADDGSSRRNNPAAWSNLANLLVLHRGRSDIIGWINS